MKPINSEDIERVKEELAAKRKEFEQIEFKNLAEKLDWIQKFFNRYVCFQPLGLICNVEGSFLCIL